MLPQMKNLNYEERLKQLKLPTLKFRRMRGDMIEAQGLGASEKKTQKKTI